MEKVPSTESQQRRIGLNRAASRARQELVESVVLIVLSVISATLATDRLSDTPFFKICGQKFGHVKISKYIVSSNLEIS